MNARPSQSKSTSQGPNSSHGLEARATPSLGSGRGILPLISSTSILPLIRGFGT